MSDVRFLYARDKKLTVAHLIREFFADFETPAKDFGKRLKSENLK
jgi:hypothetical protein